MPEVYGIEKLLSVVPKKRFGRPCQYGTSQYGFSHYGDSDIVFIGSGYGDRVYGVFDYADFLLLSGIYRTDNVTGKTRYYREPYYFPKNPRSDPQQAQRGLVISGAAAWQALTSEQKQAFNARAQGKHLTGYNLFLREYILSH